MYYAVILLKLISIFPRGKCTRNSLPTGNGKLCFVQHEMIHAAQNHLPLAGRLGSDFLQSRKPIMIELWVRYASSARFRPGQKITRTARPPRSSHTVFGDKITEGKFISEKTLRFYRPCCAPIRDESVQSRPTTHNLGYKR